MAFPDGYRLRPPADDDLDGAAAVLIADQLDDVGKIVLDADFLRNRWRRAGFDLARDAWVVVDRAGTVVAFGQATHDQPGVVESLGIVHPAHRGRGIGSALLDRIEARAVGLLAGQPSPRFRHSINASDGAAATMLEARGLRPVRHFWHMEIDLVAPLEPGSSPAGVEIAGIDSPGDLPEVHAVLEEAFAEHWGNYPEPYDQWLDEEASGPGYDSELWLRATDGGRMVGALTGNLWGERGWVGYLGVRSAGRGRGIGAALLRESFARFAARGARYAVLNVDAENTTGATALYEGVGMCVVNRWDLWERSGA
ncbi:MAG: GNAT family N-acetyltransferase [Chloroflexi bacterium]|nr:GNAT family N-acetyltransferase [Chloroflexota bacterium]